MKTEKTRKQFYRKIRKKQERCFERLAPAPKKKSKKTEKWYNEKLPIKTKEAMSLSLMYPEKSKGRNGARARY